VTVWQRFTPHARSEQRGLAALLGLALIAIGVEALLPWPLKLVVDHVLAAKPLPEAVRWLESAPGASSAGGMLAWLALASLAVFLAGQLVQAGKALLQARLSARLQLAVGSLLLEKLQALSLAYHRRAHKGDLVRRVTQDSGCLSTLVLGVALPLVASLLSLLLLFAIMWQLDRSLALVAALVAVPMAALMRFFAPRMADRAYEHEEASSQLWSVAEQTLSALPVVQAFAREMHEKSRFVGAARLSQRAYLRSLGTQVQFSLGISASQAAGIGAVMLVGGMHVLQGALTVGALIVLLSYVAALYAPLLTLAYLGGTSAAAMGSARRVIEVLDCSEQIRDEPGAKPLRRGESVHGHVRLEDVVFGYQPGRPVLHGVQFEARPGETVALVGATGAGKTSLVSLIPRFFDPWEGRVLIDGQDIRFTSLQSVRDAVAVVPQEPMLLPLTIAENIWYARPGATRAEVEAAARAANAHEFIERLPQCYETPVGERGATLSAGQRQRVAIARAILKDAPILILDEPTSALDAENEHLVLDALKRLTLGRTAIVIAHRLSTIRRADRVVVLEQGRPAELQPS
jgi:ATP-binding cassette, subfamily B, bacterial